MSDLCDNSEMIKTIGKPYITFKKETILNDVLLAPPPEKGIDQGVHQARTVNMTPGIKKLSDDG